MPELPEVETVVRGIRKKVIGKKIIKVWTDYQSDYYKGKDSIKDPDYFKKFKKNILNSTIVDVKRRAKNIFIYLDNKKIIIVHLKMTGHFLYGKYLYDKKNNLFYPKDGFISREELKNDKTLKKENEIKKNPLRDPFNRFIHFVLWFDDNTMLVLSDMRKFASIFFLNKEELQEKIDKIGPEPFDVDVEELFKKIKTKKYINKKIKTILMNPEFIAGIGNIYSDEILWKVGIHPEKIGQKITKNDLKNIIKISKEILKKSISMGGDSMSDFRNIEGKKGKYQAYHNVYKKEGTKCLKKACKGIIEKKVINGRIARFCPIHQKK